MSLYQYPEKSLVNRIIAKDKIYFKGQVNNKAKQDFVSQIQEIRWFYKLSNQTLNLSDSESFKEFEIIQIRLKGNELNHECLNILDKTIPNPIIFEIVSDQTIQVMAAYKVSNERGDGTIVKSNYFISDQYGLNEKRACLPSAISLEAFYHAILKSLMPKEIIGNDKYFIESLDVLVTKEKEFSKIGKAIVSLENRILREKQFNRKVEMNAELKQLKAMQAALLAQ